MGPFSVTSIGRDARPFLKDMAFGCWPVVGDSRSGFLPLFTVSAGKVGGEVLDQHSTWLDQMVIEI